MKKRFLTFAALMLIIFSVVLPAISLRAEPENTGTVTDTAGGNEPDISEPEADIKDFAQGIALYCVDTDTTLFTKNTDAPCNPSSSVKLMSALVAYEHINDLTESVQVTKELLSGTAGLIYGFSSGMKTTYNDLLTAMLVRNANDAALILSRTVASDTESFVALMNDKASELGMTNTKYTNPTGQGSSAQTTVGDMMKLLSAFLDNDYLFALSGLSSTKLASTNVTIHNRNFFLSRYYNGGRSYLNSNIKGGIADESGETLLSVAVVKGFTYLSVISGGTNDDNGIYSYMITDELLSWASTSFEYLTLIDTWKVICMIPVTMGDGADEVSVFPAKKVTRYMDRSTDLDAVVSYTYTLDNESLVAPVSFGDKVGTLTLFLEGEEIEVIDLVTAADVPSSSSDYILSEIRTFMKSPLFTGIAAAALSLCVIYILIAATIRGQRRKKISMMLHDKEGDE